MVNNTFKVLLFIVVVISLVGCTAKKSDSSLIGVESDWKTYQNGMFSIQYPPDWQIAESFDGIILVADESTIFITNKGDDLNFGDVSEASRSDPEYTKLGLDQFMEIIKDNDAFQNIKKTQLNSYNTYEIDSRYNEEEHFVIMVENNNGYVYQILFKNKPTKEDLTTTDLSIISSFRFIN